MDLNGAAKKVTSLVNMKRKNNKSVSCFKINTKQKTRSFEKHVSRISIILPQPVLVWFAQKAKYLCVLRTDTYSAVNTSHSTLDE